MHILEDHVVPWMSQWHLGSGLMGEQGAESIHAHMHRLERQYSNIVNPLQQLQYLVQECDIEAAPGLNTLRPEPKKHGRKGPGMKINVPYAIIYEDFLQIHPTPIRNTSTPCTWVVLHLSYIVQKKVCPRHSYILKYLPLSIRCGP